jgi:hypothetical protein
MATWKGLTRTTGESITVNIDQVMHMEQFGDHTILHFAKGDSVYTLEVKQSPDDVLMYTALLVK